MGFRTEWFPPCFYWRLTETAQTTSLPEIRVCVEECSYKLYLKVRNDAAQTCKLVVKANAYFANKTWEIETSATE